MPNNESLETTQEVNDEQTRQPLADSASEQSSQAQEVSEEVVESNEEESTVATQEVQQEEESSTSESEEETESESQEEEDDESDTEKEFTNALKKVRNEAKNLRKRLKDAQSEIEKLRAESNEEVVKERDDLQRQLTDLRNEIRDDKTKAVIAQAAQKAGAIEPDLIAEIAISKKLVTYEEDKVSNVDEVVKNLRGTYTKMFRGVAAGNGNIGNRNERGADQEGIDPLDRIRQGIAQKRQQQN